MQNKTMVAFQGGHLRPTPPLERYHFFMGGLMDLVSRQQAKSEGLTHYYTGKPCKYGHITYRYVADWKCAECAKREARHHYQNNKEKCMIAARQRYHDNAEEKKAYNRRYVEENKEKVSVARREYRQKNKDSIREYMRRWRKDNSQHVRDYMDQWRKQNPEWDHEYYKSNQSYYYAKLAERRAKLLQRTIKCKEDEINAIYAEAALMRKTGEDVHVDHICPLQGDLISGLHCPNNLQIISAYKNTSKGNKFTPYSEVY